MKIYSLTTGTEILYIDREDIYNVMSLEFIKYIKNCISLPILFQKFFKIVFEINSDQLIRYYKKPNTDYSRRINHPNYIP